MPLPFKIDELLKDHAEDREALEAYARDPGRSIDELQTWLESHGYVVSRGAVWNWKQHFDEQQMLERMSNSAKIAKVLTDMGKSDDAVTKIPQAAVLAINTRIFETINRLAVQGDIDPKDLAALSLACQRTTLSQVRIEEVREQLKSSFEAQTAKLVGKREITQADIDEVRRAVFG